MSEPGERSPLHSEWVTASAADRPVAGTQSTISLASSRIPELGARLWKGCRLENRGREEQFRFQETFGWWETESGYPPGPRITTQKSRHYPPADRTTSTQVSNQMPASALPMSGSRKMRELLRRKHSGCIVMGHPRGQ